MKRRFTVMPILLSLLVILAITATGCGSKSASNQNASNASSSPSTDETTSSNNSGNTPASTDSSVEVQPDPTYSASDNPIVTIELKSGQKIELELYPKVAPNTVNNFISLINKGFYNGLTFHRVIPGFMIQGGDPNGNGSGGPGYSIKGEFLSNGVNNDLKHTRGVISMARAQDPNSGGSQFFIMVADADSLDGQYAAFGKVIQGMQTVDDIVNLPRNSSDLPDPNDLAVMSKVTVDTKGKQYPEPDKQ